MAVAALVLLALVASALGVWRLRSRRPALLAAIEGFASAKGLAAEATGLGWSGTVKELPTRLEILGDALGDGAGTQLVISLRAPNPSAIAFALEAQGLGSEQNFKRAAPELVVALDEVKPGRGEALFVSTEGEVVYRLELSPRTLVDARWLQGRLAHCQEVARLLPKKRGPGAGSASTAALLATLPTDPDHDATEPFAEEQLTPK